MQQLVQQRTVDTLTANSPTHQGALTPFREYLRRQESTPDFVTHIPLKNDLIEHIWVKFDIHYSLFHQFNFMIMEHFFWSVNFVKGINFSQ